MEGYRRPGGCRTNGAQAGLAGIRRGVSPSGTGVRVDRGAVFGSTGVAAVDQRGARCRLAEDAAAARSDPGRVDRTGAGICPRLVVGITPRRWLDADAVLCRLAGRLFRCRRSRRRWWAGLPPVNGPPCPGTSRGTGVSRLCSRPRRTQSGESEVGWWVTYQVGPAGAAVTEISSTWRTRLGVAAVAGSPWRPSSPRRWPPRRPGQFCFRHSFSSTSDIAGRIPYLCR